MKKNEARKIDRSLRKDCPTQILKIAHYFFATLLLYIQTTNFRDSRRQDRQKKNK